MRHNDPRLTVNMCADAALFSLRGAVQKLARPGADNDSQRNSQKYDFGGLLPSLAGTVGNGCESAIIPCK